MTATIEAPVSADEAVRPLDAELENLRSAVQQAQEALQTAQTALEPLRARREALLTEDGDLDGLATEAASIAFDIDAAERKVAFLEERGQAIEGRIAAKETEREQAWVAADRPGFDHDLGALQADVALAHARFRGVALLGWEAVPKERRRYEPRWKGALNADVLERLVWPLPSGREYAEHCAEIGKLAERAQALQPRAQRHGVRVAVPEALTAVMATVEALESRGHVQPRGADRGIIRTPQQVEIEEQ